MAEGARGKRAASRKRPRGGRAALGERFRVSAPFRRVGSAADGAGRGQGRGRGLSLSLSVSQPGAALQVRVPRPGAGGSGLLSPIAREEPSPCPPRC